MFWHSIKKIISEKIYLHYCCFFLHSVELCVASRDWEVVEPRRPVWRGKSLPLCSRFRSSSSVFGHSRTRSGVLASPDRVPWWRIDPNPCLIDPGLQKIWSFDWLEDVVLVLLHFGNVFVAVVVAAVVVGDEALPVQGSVFPRRLFSSSTFCGGDIADWSQRTNQRSRCPHLHDIVDDGFCDDLDVALVVLVRLCPSVPPLCVLKSSSGFSLKPFLLPAVISAEQGSGIDIIKLFLLQLLML